jgi:ATP-dependent DNA helicase RecG
MMEKAIEVMRHSITERRNDEKPSPLVGAVLVKPDGTIETACRGELREGDHAEYTLLERKNRHLCLDGSVLFATLEPCAPGCRKHPKLSCAERIVNARIKEVWVGIADPDPTVDRKGIKFLQDNGVTVRMFERDLQEDITAANREFIAAALERKAAAEDSSKEPPQLSELEEPSVATDYRDLSATALDKYRALAVKEGGASEDEFRRALVQQGLLTIADGKAVPTGFGLLLFGSAPRRAMPQAGLLGTIHVGSGEEIRDFDGPMIEIPRQVIGWLRDRLPDVIDRSVAHREHPSSKLLEIIREAVVNALVHRDYDIRGAKCQLSVSPDAITIKSPGRPVDPVTLRQLQDFSAPMLSRNPVLHYVFAQLGLAEERGLGLKSLRTGASDLGLALPQYTWEPPYLVLTVYRTTEGAVRLLGRSAGTHLTADEKATLELILTRGSITSPELMSVMSFDERKAQRVLKKLVEGAMVGREGKGRATWYSIVR